MAHSFIDGSRGSRAIITMSKSSTPIVAARVMPHSRAVTST
jgi:hypothetical protein